MRALGWVKTIGGGLVILIGGPVLVDYVTPSEEELFKRYNPELQRRSLEGREQRLKEANEFIDKIKEYGKSDKPVWTVWKEAELEDRRRRNTAEKLARDEKRMIAQELRKQRLDKGVNDSK